MKKYGIILLLVILLMCGCGKKKETITCVYDNTLDTNRHVTTVVINLENNVAVDANATMEYEDENASNNICNIMKVADKEDGNVSCDGKKITIKNYMKSLKDSASGNFKSDKISKEDILKYFEKERYTCE